MIATHELNGQPTAVIEVSYHVNANHLEIATAYLLMQNNKFNTDRMKYRLITVALVRKEVKRMLQQHGTSGMPEEIIDSALPAFKQEAERITRKLFPSFYKY